jgi:hypothetical protein
MIELSNTRPLQLERYEELLQALSTVPSIHSADIHFEHDARVCSLALHHLSHLTDLCICSGRSSYYDVPLAEATEETLETFLEEEHFQEIAAELRNLHSLNSVELTVHSKYHNVLLPALHTIPTLTNVTLDYDLKFDWHEEFLVDESALANFFGTESSLDLEIQSLYFIDEASYQHCRTLAEARCNSFTSDKSVCQRKLDNGFRGFVAIGTEKFQVGQHSHFQASSSRARPGVS